MGVQKENCGQQPPQFSNPARQSRLLILFLCEFQAHDKKSLISGSNVLPTCKQPVTPRRTFPLKSTLPFIQPLAITCHLAAGGAPWDGTCKCISPRAAELPPLLSGPHHVGLVFLSHFTKKEAGAAQ